MKFWSTNKKAKPVSFKEALFRGLASDGGLYMSEKFPRNSGGFEKAAGFFTGLSKNTLKKIIKDVFNFSAPLVELNKNLYVQELFYGPTLSFKDFGARFMARVASAFLAKGESLNIITATSGDTGGAVAAGFYGLPNVKVFVLYPSGRVSDLQEKQIATWGGNVFALEVAGDFDDCQKLAKQALSDEALRTKLNLSSANSINIGRLLPQMFYYFEAQRQLRALYPKPHTPNPVFVVPSGNFGNLTAGLFAKKSGLRVKNFIAAVNRNSVVPKYFKTGKLQSRKTKMTYSSAMDVGTPSNWARIAALYKNKNEMARDIKAVSVSESETLRTMGGVYKKYGYIADPHTAVGIAAAEKIKGGPKIVLATAHPAKFKDIVEPTIGGIVPLPATLAEVLLKRKKSIKVDADYDDLRDILLKEGIR